MAVAMLVDNPNGSREIYDRVRDLLGLEKPGGGIVHVAGPSPNGGWRVIEVFESYEDAAVRRAPQAGLRGRRGPRPAATAVLARAQLHELGRSDELRNRDRRYCSPPCPPLLNWPLPATAVRRWPSTDASASAGACPSVGSRHTLSGLSQPTQRTAFARRWSAPSSSTSCAPDGTRTPCPPAVDFASGSDLGDRYRRGAIASTRTGRATARRNKAGTWPPSST
jgi:hypothetical protein